MKILSLRKKIIINSSIAGILLVIFGIIFNFYLHQESNVRVKVDKLDVETLNIKTQTFALENKAAEFKKYKEVWGNLSPGKKNTDGVKIDDVNSKLTHAKEKYSIGDTNLKITLPEILKENIFKRETVSVLFTTVNLTFTAVSDVKALLFANEFLDSLPGYPIVTYFEIRKSKDYTSQDFTNISSGSSSGLIACRLDFAWYIYKEKEIEKKTEIKLPIMQPAKGITNAAKPIL